MSRPVVWVQTNVYCIQKNMQVISSSSPINMKYWIVYSENWLNTIITWAIIVIDQSKLIVSLYWPFWTTLHPMHVLSILINLYWYKRIRNALHVYVVFLQVPHINIVYTSWQSIGICHIMWEFKVKSFGELTMFQYYDSNDMNDASFMQINPH